MDKELREAFLRLLKLIDDLSLQVDRNFKMNTSEIRLEVMKIRRMLKKKEE